MPTNSDLHASHARFVYCDPQSNSSTWHGRAVDLMRYFARQNDLLELTNGPDGVVVPANTSGRHGGRDMFYFNCSPYQAHDLLELMSQDTNGSFCSVAMGAIAISQSRYNMPNFKFSIPYTATGLGVLIAQSPVTGSYSMWGFLKPFNWTLWTALLVTLAVLPIVIYIVENLVRTGSIPVCWHTLHDLQLTMYKTVLTIFTVDVVTVLTLPSQIILVCYCFTNLVVVATYTANLVTYLQGVVVVNGIQSMTDLINTPVYANEIYVELLKQSDYLLATPLIWNGLDTFHEVKAGLLNGSMTAYVQDYPKLLVYQQLYDPQCQLAFLPSIEQVFYGAAIHDSQPPQIEDLINNGVLSAQNDGTLTRLNKIYLSNNVCTPSLPPTDVLFSQLSGLWAILGCAVGIGIIGSIHGIWRHHIHPAHLESQQKQAEGEKLTRKRMPSMKTVATSLSKVLVHPKEIQRARSVHQGQAQTGSLSSQDIEVGGGLSSSVGPSPRMTSPRMTSPRMTSPRMTSFRPHSEANGEGGVGPFRPHYEKLQEMQERKSGSGSSRTTAFQNSVASPSEERNSSRLDKVAET
jgi:hypothetical protein